MAEDLNVTVTYNQVNNYLEVCLWGPERVVGSPSSIAGPRRVVDLLGSAKVTVDAPKDLIDKEIERVKAELLERHRTVTAMIEKHNGKPAIGPGAS